MASDETDEGDEMDEPARGVSIPAANDPDSSIPEVTDPIIVPPVSAQEDYQCIFGFFTCFV